MGKRVIYLIIFIVAIAGVVGLVIFFNNATTNRDAKIANAANNLGNKTKTEVNSNVNPEITTIDTTTTATTTSQKAKLPTTVTELDDGTLYQIGEPLESVDIVVGDNMYNTQITDFNYNFPEYEGKTIEIEGMFMKNEDKLLGYCYTFVGRYSNVASTCCPQGYAYFEYEWYGDQEPRLVDEITWLKVRGTLTQGEDAGGPYFYIAANSMEVMNERGQDTVNN